MTTEVTKHDGHAPLTHRVLIKLLPVSQVFVVSGFWRSGTTWLQQVLVDLLHARGVFEPLHPSVRLTKDLYEPLPIPHRHFAYLDGFMPSFPDGLVVGSAQHSALKRILSGRVDERWIHRVKSSRTDFVRRRVVTKFVRASLCLDALSEYYSVPIVHVDRDPRAVVASITRDGWGDWFGEFAIADQLLNVGDGRREFFEPWEDLICGADEQGIVSKVAVYWAMTEQFVIQNYQQQLPRLVVARYEDICSDPERVLRGMFETWGIPADRGMETSLVDDDSATTRSTRRGLSREARVNGWKRELSAAQVDEIERLVASAGLEHRL